MILRLFGYWWQNYNKYLNYAKFFKIFLFQFRCAIVNSQGVRLL